MALIYSPVYIVNQIDERTFQASLSGIDWIMKCYLSHELFRENIRENIRPLVGDLVILEYNSGLRRIKRRVHYIIEVI